MNDKLQMFDALDAVAGSRGRAQSPHERPQLASTAKEEPFNLAEASPTTLAYLGQIVHWIATEGQSNVAAVVENWDDAERALLEKLEDGQLVASGIQKVVKGDHTEETYESSEIPRSVWMTRDRLSICSIDPSLKHELGGVVELGSAIAPYGRPWERWERVSLPVGKVLEFWPFEIRCATGNADCAPDVPPGTKDKPVALATLERHIIQLMEFAKNESLKPPTQTECVKLILDNVPGTTRNPIRDLIKNKSEVSQYFTNKRGPQGSRIIDRESELEKFAQYLRNGINSVENLKKTSLSI